MHLRVVLLACLDVRQKKREDWCLKAVSDTMGSKNVFFIFSFPLCLQVNFS